MILVRFAIKTPQVALQKENFPEQLTFSFHHFDFPIIVLLRARAKMSIILRRLIASFRFRLYYNQIDV